MRSASREEKSSRDTQNHRNIGLGHPIRSGRDTQNRSSRIGPNRAGTPQSLGVPARRRNRSGTPGMSIFQGSKPPRSRPDPQSRELGPNRVIICITDNIAVRFLFRRQNLQKGQGEPIGVRVRVPSPMRQLKNRRATGSTLLRGLNATARLSSATVQNDRLGE